MNWPCCVHCKPQVHDQPHPDQCLEFVVYEAMAGDPRPQPCQGAPL